MLWFCNYCYFWLVNYWHLCLHFLNGLSFSLYLRYVNILLFNLNLNSTFFLLNQFIWRPFTLSQCLLWSSKPTRFYTNLTSSPWHLRLCILQVPRYRLNHRRHIDLYWLRPIFERDFLHGLAFNGLALIILINLMRLLSFPKCHHFILVGRKLLACLDELSFVLPIVRYEKVAILLDS